MDENTPTFLGSNITLVKSHNLRAVLLSLLHNDRISRVQLADMTMLSTTTITNLIGELVDQGIVVESDSEEKENGKRSVGRPRTALTLIPDARYAVGVHIGIGLIRVAVTDLQAQIVHNNFANYVIEAPYEQILTLVADLIEKTITDSKVNRKKIIGVGFGASGLVDFQSGVNVLAPTLGWREVPIREWLSERVHLPVCVDNNVRAMTLGESLFGLGRGVKSLALVYGRVGVGSGIVVKGEVFRGSAAGAGEIGHTIILPEGGDVCRCGKRGCLETLVSEQVIIKQAEALAKQNPNSLLASYLRKQNSDKPIDRIFAAARDGDTATRNMIEHCAYYLGIALTNLVNVLNPELILLAGMFAQGEDLFLPVVQKTVREQAFAGLGERVRVQSTGFGWRAGVIGAAALALNAFFYQQPEVI
jgi:glucokinase-like ROK family protein